MATRTPPEDRCAEVGCRDLPVGICAFELTGRLDGKRCARRFCDHHLRSADGKLICGPHARLIERGE